MCFHMDAFLGFCLKWKQIPKRAITRQESPHWVRPQQNFVLIYCDRIWRGLLDLAHQNTGGAVQFEFPESNDWRFWFASIPNVTGSILCWKFFLSYSVQLALLHIVWSCDSRDSSWIASPRQDQVPAQSTKSRWVPLTWHSDYQSLRQQNHKVYWVKRHLPNILSISVCLLKCHLPHKPWTLDKHIQFGLQWRCRGSKWLAGPLQPHILMAFRKLAGISHFHQLWTLCRETHWGRKQWLFSLGQNFQFKMTQG